MTTPIYLRSRPGAVFLTLVIATAGGIGTSGCSQLWDRPGDDLWDVASAEGNDITLLVRNENYYDARVFVRWNGERQRLGLVTGLTSETFTMPGRTGTLRLEVDFVATGGFVSPRVDVDPGDHLTFRIPSQTR